MDVMCKCLFIIQWDFFFSFNANKQKKRKEKKYVYFNGKLTQIFSSLSFSLAELSQSFVNLLKFLEIAKNSYLIRNVNIRVYKR